MENLSTPATAELQIIMERSKGRAMTNIEIQETLQQSLDLLKTSPEQTRETELIQNGLVKSIDALLRLSVVTDKGFAEMYLAVLPDFETPLEAFEDINDYYHQSYGEWKYNSFQDFKNTLGMG